MAATAAASPPLAAGLRRRPHARTGGRAAGGRRAVVTVIARDTAADVRSRRRRAREDNGRDHQPAARARRWTCASPPAIACARGRRWCGSTIAQPRRRSSGAPSSGRDAAEQAGRARRPATATRRAPRWRSPPRPRASSMLHERKSATDDELDQAVARLRTAEARLAGAEARRRTRPELASPPRRPGRKRRRRNASWAVVTAPFDGVVTEKLVETGQHGVARDAALPHRAGRARCDSTCASTSRARAPFHAGEDVEVRFDADVAQASPLADRPAGHGTGHRDCPRRRGRRARLPREDRPAAPTCAVTSGAFARARFAGPPRRVLVVPRAAVVRRRPAHLGLRRGRRARAAAPASASATRVPSGGTDRWRCSPASSEGERVVVDPSPAVHDGVRVRSAERAQASAARGTGGAVSQPRGMAGRLAAAFIDSRLTPLVIVASHRARRARRRRAAARGGAADHRPDDRRVRRRCPARRRPRSSSASRGRSRSCCGRFPGVEYLYSTSSPGLSMVIVRFCVGQDGGARARPPEPEARGQHGPASRRARRRRSSSRARSTTCRSWR